jgi:hypothetical protein
MNDGAPEGRGIRIYYSGDVVIGHWVNGKAEGKVRVVGMDGRLLQGEWKEGTVHQKEVEYDGKGSKVD